LSAFALNFTLHDIIGAALATFLFPLVIVFPGYVTGWALDLFDFKNRQPVVRLGIGLVLSFAVSPIVLDLTSSLLSLNASLFTLGGFAAAFAVIILKEKPISSLETKNGVKTILWIGGVWIVIAILSLIDIQWKDQLYFSVISYDQSTRVSVINAMTRTGVPPINPSYYPGHPVRLTFLYYFWYILGSVIDVIGGRYVDARAALTAGSAWCGLGLMATIALYLRQRNAGGTGAVWRSARIGVGLLAVSGLDALPIAIIMIVIGSMVSSVDIWNTVIGSWLATNLWAPLHIAALIAGLGAMMLAHFARGQKTSRRFAILAVAGLGFASALGLSVWVTFVFVLFWIIWLAALFIQKTDCSLIVPMIFAGILAILLTSPFLIELFRGGSGGAGQFPILFRVRTLLLMEFFTKDWSLIASSLVMLAVLPINYLLELGFFFVAGIHWIKSKGRVAYRSNPFYLAEVLLLAVVLFIGSFLRSSLLVTNDLGWRSWIPGQFILLIWGVDILEGMVFSVPAKNIEAMKTRKLLLTLVSIGILTTIMDAVILRSAWPVLMGKDDGRRSYSAHLAYDYLRNNISADVITQNNPLDVMDRPSGLYGIHQMVVSDRTAYGVSMDAFRELKAEIGILFTNRHVTDWQLTDRICREHLIDVLIIKDTDPIWDSLSILKSQRPALYENEHYAIFSCGDYARNNP
jgi:hypothetical protein